MSVTATVLIQPKVAEDVQTAQFTSAGAITLIDKFTARNYSGTAADLSINLIQRNDVAGDNNLVAKRTLQPGETYLFPEVVGHYLGDGDSISTLAGTATSISIRSSGRVVSTV